MKKIFLIILTSLISFHALANSLLETETPTMKMPLPGLNVTAIFLKIINKSDEDLKLVKVKGEFATEFELHTMEMKNGMMKMRPIDFIPIKSKSTIELKSGGYHIMVFDLKKTLKKSEIYKATLVFDNKEEILVKVKAIETE